MRLQFNRGLAMSTTLCLVILFVNCQKTSPPPQTYKPQDFSSSLALKWNNQILNMAVEEDGLLTLKGVRTTALIHLAMHDALNATHALYQPYALDTTAIGAHPIAAALTAAYEVAHHEFPDQQNTLKSLKNAALDTISNQEALLLGVTLGQNIAQSILGQRAQDNWNAEAEYTWHPMAPGVYAEFHEHSGTPEGFIFGAGWAQAKPFALDSASHFRAPPPPEISSDAYAEAFDEVKSLGATNSTTRSQDQAHLAMWWKDFVENSHNRLARQVIGRGAA